MGAAPGPPVARGAAAAARRWPREALRRRFRGGRKIGGNGTVLATGRGDLVSLEQGKRVETAWGSRLGAEERQAMLRRASLAVAVVAILAAGGVSYGMEVTDHLVGSTTLTNGSVLSWSITPPPSTPGNWTYSYTLNAVADTVYLETSTGLKQSSTFVSWPVGSLAEGPKYFSSPGIYGLKINTSVDQNAGTSAFSFVTAINPVYGDFWASSSMKNKGFGSDPSFGTTQDEAVIQWAATVDSGGASDIIVPEPSLSILALVGLAAGAFARRKKKEAA